MSFHIGWIIFNLLQIHKVSQINPDLHVVVNIKHMLACFIWIRAGDLLTLAGLCGNQ
jgi:hypothetical protein